MIPGLRNLPATIKSGLGFGAYETTKARLGGEEMLPAAVGGFTSGALMHGAGKLGATAVPGMIPGAERLGSAIGGATMGLLGNPEEPLVGATIGAGFGAKYPSTRISRSNVPINKRENIASNLISKVLGLKKSDYRYSSFGKGKESNPALTVIRENIGGGNIDDLSTNLKSKISDINTEVNGILNTASTPTPTTGVMLKSYSSALRPLLNVRAELMRDPQLNSAKIAKIDEMLMNFRGETLTPTGKRTRTRGAFPIDSATVVDAYQLKQRVADAKKNAFTEKAGDKITNALKAVNYRLGEMISKEAGKLKGIDKNYIKQRLKVESDLITADNALDNNIRELKAKESFLPDFIKSARIGAGIGTAVGGATGGLFGGLIGTYTGAQLERMLLTPNNRIKLARWLIETPKAQQNIVYQKFPQLKTAINAVKSKIPKITSSGFRIG